MTSGNQDLQFLEAAIGSANRRARWNSIGSVLVIDDKIVGRGHNRRVQKRSAVAPKWIV